MIIDNQGNVTLTKTERTDLARGYHALCDALEGMPSLGDHFDEATFTCVRRWQRRLERRRPGRPKKAAA